MCSPLEWWWITFFVILLSGVFGGMARMSWDRADAKDSKDTSYEDGPWWTYVVLGVAGAFVVPLFLSTISSNLIRDAAESPDKLFILIGFCLAAAAFSRQFMGSVSKKALDLADQANKAARDAKTSAQVAEADAKNADNRAIGIMEAFKFIDNDRFDEAISLLDELIENDPKHSEAHAWYAYCLKRKERYQDAINSIKTALQYEQKDVYRWLFNLACYQALNGEPAAEVVATLERVKNSANNKQRETLSNDLRTEEDFATVRDIKEFQDFLLTL